MIRVLKLLAVLVVLCAVGVTGYAYLGDMAPVQGDVRVPVTLDGN